MDRKAKVTPEMVQNKSAHSTKIKQSKQKYCLSKPNINQSILQKNNHHTLSTMISSNPNIHVGHKKSKTFLKRNKNVQLSNEIQKVIRALKKQNQRTSFQEQERQATWNEVLQRAKMGVQNNKLREVLTLIQKGYRAAQKPSQSIPKAKHPKQIKTQNIQKQNHNSKLTLNLYKINKNNIKDYHDQFMDKFQQFSPSWRQMIQHQKKITC